MSRAPASRRPTPPRGVPVANSAAQTEATFFSPNMTVDKAYERLHHTEYDQLLRVRDHVRQCMTQLGVGVHDLYAVKDIMVRHSDVLPQGPITDILLISSKLFRRLGELSRGLGVFFQVAFADDFVDDDFRFTEARVLRRANRELKQQLRVAAHERDEWKARHDALAAEAETYQATLDGSTARARDLEATNAGLQDQMAALFQRIAGDFLFSKEAALREADHDADVQRKLSAVRAQFLQSLDAVQTRVKAFQGTVHDLQDEAGTIDGTAGLRQKLKALDTHLGHISSRFGVVREGLVNTAQDLMTALLEKRKALQLSVQHLKAYEVQNSRLRAVRQQMASLRTSVAEAERVVSKTFSGAPVGVDKTGAIGALAQDAALAPPTGSSVHGVSPMRARPRGASVTLPTSPMASPLKPGPGLSAGEPQRTATPRRTSISRRPASPHQGAAPVPVGREWSASTPLPAGAATHISALHQPLQAATDALTRMSQALALDDEHKALLKAVAASVPSQVTKPSASGPAGGLPSAAPSPPRMRDRRASRPSTLDAAPTTQPDLVDRGAAVAARVAEQQEYGRLREDFAAKLAFMRDVYEDRIADLEAKLERVHRKFVAARRDADDTSPDPGGRQVSVVGAAISAAAVGTVEDRDAAAAARDGWARSKRAVVPEERESASAALGVLSRLETGVLGSSSELSPVAAAVLQPPLATVAPASITVASATPSSLDDAV